MKTSGIFDTARTNGTHLSRLVLLPKVVRSLRGALFSVLAGVIAAIFATILGMRRPAVQPTSTQTREDLATVS